MRGRRKRRDNPVGGRVWIAPNSEAYALVDERECRREFLRSMGAWLIVGLLASVVVGLAPGLAYGIESGLFAGVSMLLILLGASVTDLRVPFIEWRAAAIELKELGLRRAP